MSIAFHNTHSSTTSPPRHIGDFAAADPIPARAGVSKMPGAGLARWWQTGRTVVAIGRNYRLHALELKNELPAEPFWFLKPASSYLPEGEGGSIVVPRGLEEIHHETELGVVIKHTAKGISREDAMEVVGGYCLALDMTAREWQSQAKAKGLPWTAAKGFDTSLPISQFIPKERVPDPQALTLWCKVNEEERQRGSTANMIFPIPELIARISAVHTLGPGDLILTGTPEGVGPVRRGDCITAGIQDLNLSMQFHVV